MQNFLVEVVPLDNSNNFLTTPPYPIEVNDEGGRFPISPLDRAPTCTFVTRAGSAVVGTMVTISKPTEGLCASAGQQFINGTFELFLPGEQVLFMAMENR